MVLFRALVLAGALAAWAVAWRSGSGWWVLVALLVSALVPLAFVLHAEVRRYRWDEEAQDWQEVAPTRLPPQVRRPDPNGEAPWDRL